MASAHIPDYMQQSAIFKNIGRIAIEMYLLFQHHTTLEMLRNVNSDLDLFTVTGTGWHFVKYLGPCCRGGRTRPAIREEPTARYGRTHISGHLFPKVAMLPPSVQHCIWMLSVPVIYPRLDTVETLANTFATRARSAVNYDIQPAWQSNLVCRWHHRWEERLWQQGFTQVKKAVGKSGLMGNVLNQFGDFEIADELKDLWTHESKDLERTYLYKNTAGDIAAEGYTDDLPFWR